MEARLIERYIYGIIIRTLMVSKIFCIYRLNRWCNILDPVRKIHAVTRTKVDRNKGICPDFSSNILYVCRDDHNEMTLAYLAMNPLSLQIQYLPCLSLVLIRLDFIIHLIESAFTSLLLTNPDTLLRKLLEAFSDIDVRLEAITCE